VNKFISSVESPETIVVADRIRALERRGKKIIKLQTGEPDLKTHKEIIKALEISISKGETHYVDSRGLPELREAISNWLKERYQTSVDSEKNVLITAGGVQAIFLTLTSILNPSDEVILLEPYYPQYANIVKLLGGIVRPIPVIFYKSSYRINYKVLKKTINRKTRALIINSPNNPSGKIFSSEEVESIVKIMDGKRMYILSDEIYHHIIDTDKKHTSLLEYPEAFSRVIYINSFSKTYAMAGWRLGFLVATGEIIDRILKILQLNITCVPPFIQRAGIVALKNKDVQKYIQVMKEKYNERRKCVYNLVKSYPFFKIYPEGAFYYLFQLPFSSSNKVRRWISQLLEEKHVAVVSGSVYGSSFDSFFRISFSIEDGLLYEGINRIIDFYEKKL